MRKVKLGSLFADSVTSIDPRSFPDETFELWSIPASDVGKPEIELGSSIGSTKKCVKPNDVMLSKIVPHIRRAVVVTENRKIRQVASSEWIIFRSPDFWPAYLRHLLVSDRFHQKFMNTTAGVGGSLLRARPDAVAKIEISLPSLDEQRRIAAILDQADDLRRKRRLALEKLAVLPQAIFQHMFGDPVRNSGNWPLTTLAGLVTGFDTGKNIVAEDALNPAARYRVLKISSVGASGYDGTQSKALPDGYVPPSGHLVRTGDLLITRANTRELVGRVAFVEQTPDHVYLPDKILRFVFRSDVEIEVRYIQAVFDHPSMRRLLDSLATGTSGSMKNLAQSKLLSIKIALPPVRLQRAFSAAYEGASALTRSHREYRSRLDQLFASLQHRAFSETLMSLSAEAMLASV